jgi:hypothetical protein
MRISVIAEIARWIVIAPKGATLVWIAIAISILRKVGARWGRSIHLTLK